ncbi:MAG TPA: Nudix family hydrolase [Chromatiales bacterium]|nr:Nudix family hydrolase [Thiotrichales bacterium]HIP68726.1 Nudix family hydrolase [Chromatiales bacterium]
MGKSEYIHVVAAVVIQNNRVLIARRTGNVHQGGKWEFPGGKIENDESVTDALVRELKEELGIKVTRFRPLIKIRHEYSEKKVLLDVWQVDEFQGEAVGKEGQPVAWVLRETLDQYEFPEANIPVLNALELPDYCAITPVDMTLNSEVFSRVEEMIINHPMVLLRTPLLARGGYYELAKKLAKITSRCQTKLLLNSDAESVYEFNAAGLHYSTRRLMSAVKRPIGKDKYFSAACHNVKELKQAIKIDADFIFLSPVNQTLSHPQTESMGWRQFAFLSEQVNRPVFALGGVSRADLLTAWEHGAQGVAGISQFWKSN